MNDEYFWIFCWGIAAAALVSIVAISQISSQATNAKMVEMVKAGANPIAAECALTGAGTHEALCLDAARGVK